MESLGTPQIMEQASKSYQECSDLNNSFIENAEEKCPEPIENFKSNLTGIIAETQFTEELNDYIQSHQFEENIDPETKSKILQEVILNLPEKKVSVALKRIDEDPIEEGKDDQDVKCMSITEQQENFNENLKKVIGLSNEYYKSLAELNKLAEKMAIHNHMNHNEYQIVSNANTNKFECNNLQPTDTQQTQETSSKKIIHEKTATKFNQQQQHIYTSEIVSTIAKKGVGITSNEFASTINYKHMNSSLNASKKKFFSLRVVNPKLSYFEKSNFCSNESAKIKQFLHGSTISNKLIAVRIKHLTTDNGGLLSSKQLGKTKFEKKEKELNCDETFDENTDNKFLHYFAPNTKKVYLLNLEGAEEIVNLTEVDFSMFNLEIDFNIFEGYRSVITSFGDIFITAGKKLSEMSLISSGSCWRTEINNKLTVSQKPEDYSNTLHMLDFEKCTLLELPPMNYFRRSHGIAILNQYIYVFGGKGYTMNPRFSGIDVLSKCERYSIIDQIWARLNDCLYATYDMGTCVYQGRYILKMGGLNAYGINEYSIERFDTVRNNWEKIELQLPDFISDLSFANTLSVQMSENEIFILGGISNLGDNLKNHYILELPQNLEADISRKINNTRVKNLFNFMNFSAVDSSMSKYIDGGLSKESPRLKDQSNMAKLTILKTNILSFLGTHHPFSNVVYKKDIYFVRKNYTV